MELIKKKKIPLKAVNVILYFSLCFSCWYYMRQLMAYFAVVYFSGIAALVLANAVVGSLLGGLVCYLVINSLITRSLHPYQLSGVDNATMAYVFKLAFAAAGIVYGGLSFVYFVTPLISLYGEYILRFIVYTVFLVIGYVYCVRAGLIRKESIGRSLYSVFGTYLIAYTAIVALKLLIYYMMGVS